MNEMDYKPNSHKYKEEQAALAAADEKKKVEKVISGTVRTKKKSGFSKFRDELLPDNTPSIKTYIIKDVVIPTIKRVISDTVDIFLYGSTKKERTTGTRISYRDYYDSPSKRVETQTRVTGYTYDDVIFDSRGEAEQVLSQMNDLIDTYQMVSVADLYDLVGITGNFTDNRYGWTNLRNAEVQRVRDGYVIRFPKALPIK
jgi:hypothetical protein